MKNLHLTGAALALAAFLPATALAGSPGASAEIEMLKQENAQMKEMMMQMQEQLQMLMSEAEAMKQKMERKAAKRAKAKEEGMMKVKSKKEGITISTTGGGIKVKSSNGNQFKVGARVQIDHDNFDAFWNGDGPGSAEENKIRRSRFSFAGSSGKHWSYKLIVNIDHEGGNDNIDTGFAQYKSKPMHVRFGKFKRPGLMEMRNSSKWLTAIERSVLTDMAAGLVGKPSFGGVAVGFATKGDMPVSGELGIYDGETDDADGGDEYGIGARISATPKFANGSFMHAGASYFTTDNAGGNWRFRSRMGLSNTGRPFDTGNFATDDIDKMGLELGYVAGPFSLQSEYLSVETDAANAESSDIDASGFYVQAAYTLTGESVGYKSGNGTFTGLKPKGEMGAWELVARYEDADVDVKRHGREANLQTMVLGVNWYANRNAKFMLNYVDSEIEDCGAADDNEARHNAAFATCGYNDQTDGNALSLRAQYSF